MAFHSVSSSRSWASPSYAPGGAGTAEDRRWRSRSRIALEIACRFPLSIASNITSRSSGWTSRLRSRCRRKTFMSRSARSPGRRSARSLSDRPGVGEPVGRLTHHLERAHGGVLVNDLRDHAHGRLAQRSELVHEGNVHSEAFELQDPPHHLGADEQRIIQRRRTEALVHHDHAAPGRPLENPVHADQLVLELAAQRLDVLLPLEMRVDPVGQEQPRLRPGTRRPRPAR